MKSFPSSYIMSSLVILLEACSFLRKDTKRGSEEEMGGVEGGDNNQEALYEKRFHFQIKEKS